MPDDPWPTAPAIVPPGLAAPAPTECPAHQHPTIPVGQLPAFSAMPAVPGYAIEREIGRGGMGVVYKATQVNLKRPVALKMIRAAELASAEEVERFLTEAEAVAALRHAHIVSVHELGRYGELPYLALEYVEGGTLGARLSGGPLSPGDAVRLVERVARAVQHAHDTGIIHRDLKPDNILLTADGEPKVTDFGLARHIDGDTRTRTGAILGTPSYMAPEQAAGRVKDIGPRADVYALGAILYECLVGKPPFQAASPAETLVLVLNDPPRPPRQVRPEVPRDLETIALTCLRKEPAKRYASAGAMADDLRRFLEGQPIVARRPGVLERVWRGARRYRGAMIGAMVFLAVWAALLVNALMKRESLAVRRACEPEPWGPAAMEVVEGPPPAVDWSGFEVLEHSGLWDFRQWQPVPAGRIKSDPIEPAYRTNALRLRKRPGAANANALRWQFRTSGLAVHPRCQGLPYRVRQYRYTATMPRDRQGKAQVPMTAREIEVDLSEVGNNGEVFEVVLHSLWYNAFQDQQRGERADWCASRLDFEVGHSSETVWLPRSKRLTRWGFSDFQVGAKAPEASDQAPGTRVDPDRGVLYWEIPQPRQGWVYRIDWSWQDR